MKKTILLLTFAVIFGCDREIPNPVSYPDYPELPPTPINLSLAVGDHSLFLDWQISDSSHVARYRVHRAEFVADTVAPSFVVIDSAASTAYIDANLQNGRRYVYKVSARNQNGLEGYSSEMAVGTPNLFSMSINDGAPVTGTRAVVLRMLGPADASFMRISNSPDMADSPWEAYDTLKHWILTEGQGTKTVYAVLRDGDGNSTHDIISESIIFEIQSYSYSIRVDGDAPVTYSRDVEVTITAPAGTSYMKISNSADYAGASWEPLSASRPWFIQPQAAASGDSVSFYCSFRDESGDSLEVEAFDSIHLLCAEPVDLLPVFQQPDSYQSVRLQWSQSLSADFQAYRLFRSIGTTLVDTAVTIVNTLDQTSHLDSLGLRDFSDGQDRLAYYMIRLYSIYGDSSDSDTIQVVLRNNEPPTVSCFLDNVTYDSSAFGGIDITAVLTWSRSTDPDFFHYVVYENTQPDSATALPIYFSYAADSVAYAIYRHADGPVYSWHYWLKVFDLGGRASPFSQPVSISN